MNDKKYTVAFLVMIAVAIIATVYTLLEMWISSLHMRVNNLI